MLKYNRFQNNSKWVLMLKMIIWLPGPSLCQRFADHFVDTDMIQVLYGGLGLHP
jgi:hypothetical protein